MPILIIILAAFMPASLTATVAKAATVDSQMISPGKDTPTMRDIDELKVRRALENKIVAGKLLGHGLTSEEVSAKLNRMSDEQVHQMAALADKVPAGGDAGLGIVVALLVIVALVLLIVFLYKRV
ncbi:MAG: PA2779 family protein [Thermodesulfobacteriota bacterium]